MRAPRPKTDSHLPPEVRDYAREHSLAALKNLVDLMKTAKSEAVRLAACYAVLQHADRSPGNTNDSSLIEFFSRIPNSDAPPDSG